MTDDSNSRPPAASFAEQILQEMMYSVSHDLGASVRAIQGFSDLLTRRYADVLDDEGRTFLRLMGQGARDLQAQLDALLAYSRVHTRGQPRRSTEVAAAWQVAVESSSGSIREAGAIVEQGELPTVLADPQQLAMLLSELLLNALKFRGAERPHVRISAIRPDWPKSDRPNDHAGWTLRVTDNGPGIAPQNLTRVFRMFQRLCPDQPGVGAGLTIAQRIVQRHGGAIWAESTLGQGTSICFTLPASDGTANQANACTDSVV